ncbi:MAG: hypothetical protein HY079_00265 [Elusimicrobia bacterium]|nr:hypothetical protein [Elusimicrobiota bacterium]
MTRLAVLAALLALAGPVRAGDAAAPAATARSWVRMGGSLVLFGADGAPAVELPLREPDSEGTVSHETLGAPSPDGALAWTLDRRLTWSPGRTKVVDSRRQLKMFGSDGAELWRDDQADLPERGEAVLFSADGKTLLYSRRNDSGWTAEARDWMGSTRATLGPYPRLISMALTPNGRYALARWVVPDASDTHSFIDLSDKRRKDVASSDLLLGVARIGDDGVVRSGSRVVFDFNASTAAAKAPEKP